MNPDYPIYIISKGRADTRLTSKALEKMNVPYFIVVEPQEYLQYAAVISPDKILQLPFSNLGQGSIPARNWVWEHAITSGVARHWILDDNIYRFWRYNNNSRTVVTSGTIFRIAEDFVDRYENVGLAGFQYDFFAPHRAKHPAFSLNTRIYSCMLIKNDIDLRWRGKYNEDTDLSLRILKSGLCTVLFYAFQIKKVQTLTMGGGNTDTIYNTGDKRREFAESLKAQHPDVVDIVWRYNRWHHDVDYRRFQYNKLIRRPMETWPEGVNNYGMVLKQIK